MCGIAGVIGFEADAGRAATQRMLNAMIHRGPDQHGLFQGEGDNPVTLGHRRLSILDLSEAGRQPMIDPASGVALSYNGECYNFREVRAELEASGHGFVSGSDTEVLLRAYLEWGESFVSRIRGMFAFAIWDPRSGKLLLARDRLGIKPLYVARQNGRLLFASELRALLASGAVERRLDPDGVQSYLWHGFVAGPGTIVRGIQLLDAGSMVRVDRSGSIGTVNRFWDLPASRSESSGRSEGPAVRSELETAVEQHLQADVPLGIFLSGGIDSSVVAAMAAEVSSSPVITFNLGFDEGRYDESRYAHAVATELGTEHREIRLTEQAFDEQLGDALESLDQPSFDSINTYFVSRAVREAGLTVALAGTGGDELFGGYSSFVDIPRAQSASRLAGMMPARPRAMLAHAVTRLLMGAAGEVRQQTRWGKLSDFLAAAGDPVAMYQVSYALFSREFLAELQLSEAASMPWGLAEQQYAALRQLVADEPVAHAISQLELSSFLRERLLRDTDAASMAVSLEVRVPLLDHRFVEAVAGLPLVERFEPMRRKQFLRELIRGRVDPAVFERPKAGFELPLDLWCRQRLASRLDETLQDINLAHACGLNAESIGRLWRAFRRDAPGIYWSRVWGLFVFMTWCKRHRVFA